MIKIGTKVKVSDNSGANMAKCINILGHSNRKTASVGDKIVVAIKSVRASKTAQSKGDSGATKSAQGLRGKSMGVKKGEVYRALVIRTKVLSKASIKASPTLYWFEDNAVVLLNPKGEALASRLFGPVSGKELGKMVSVLSMAPQVL